MKGTRTEDVHMVIITEEASNYNMELKIDEEFQNVLPRLAGQELNRLEENIVKDGECHEPLIVWNDTIIDGHNRWAIIQKHPEIKYEIKQKEFSNRDEAIYWILKNQLGRRNLSSIQFDIALNAAYDARKKMRRAHLGNDYAKKHMDDNTNNLAGKQNPPKVDKTPSGGKKSLRIVAEDFNVAVGMVERAREAVLGLDAAGKVSPAFKQNVINGNINVPKIILQSMRGAPPESLSFAIDAIENDDLDAARKALGIHYKRKARERPKDDVHMNIKRAIDGMNKTEDDELGTLKTEIPAIADDFIRKINRIYEIHNEAVFSAGGVAVMIEQFEKVQNMIQERLGEINERRTRVQND